MRSGLARSHRTGFRRTRQRKRRPLIRHCGESAVRRQTSVEGQRLDRAGNAMTRFVNAYQKACPGQTLTYTSNGSGAGVSEFLAGQTDFGGSDSPLAGDEYDKAKQRCGSDAWNLPVVFGPLAITYNLQAVDRLVLDAPTLAKIFNGTITRWDDPAIKALNSEEMPSEPIQVVYRSDG
jgi:phosphate transport system substrate-binding protein